VVEEELLKQAVPLNHGRVVPRRYAHILGMARIVTAMAVPLIDRGRLVADEASSHGPRPDKQRTLLWLAGYPLQNQADLDRHVEYRYRGSEVDVNYNGGVPSYGPFSAACRNAHASGVVRKETATRRVIYPSGQAGVR
jgi:hypothetical protein